MKKNGIFLMFAMLMLAFGISSCSNDKADEEEAVVEMPDFVNNLPEATDIKCTSAYIPVYDKGEIELLVNNDPNLYDFSMIRTRKMNPDGFRVRLLPSMTWYYTLIKYDGDKVIKSNQIKSFTTKSLEIEMQEPEINEEGLVSFITPRAKTTGIEEEDLDIFRIVFHIAQAGKTDNYSSRGGQYEGDGIWKSSFTEYVSSPIEVKAIIIDDYHNQYAETPWITYK